MNPWCLAERSPDGNFYYVKRTAVATRLIRPPPCKCADCEASFYQVEEQDNKPSHCYRLRLDEEQARRNVEALLAGIHCNRNKLREALKASADLIMSRWKKMSQAKRVALLKEADPNLEEKQWLSARWNYNPERLLFLERCPKRRYQLLLSWLNVEVLKSNPHVLFALLHYRAEYPPQDWAAFDCRQHNVHWAMGNFDVDYAEACVVMHGEEYGAVTRWSRDAAHRADILGYPRAFLVLDAQDHLMKLLSNIADCILGSRAGPGNVLQPPRADNWRVLTSQGAFKEVQQIEFWPSYTNPAFSPPPSFDSEHLLSIASSNREATSDHLWHLQCDSSYFRRHLKIILSTRVFSCAKPEWHGTLLTNRIYFDIASHCWWQWIEAECRHVDILRKRHFDNIRPGHALPAEYDRALAALGLLVVNQFHWRVAFFRDQLLPFVSGFEKHWIFFRSPDSQGVLGQIDTSAREPNCIETLTEDPLEWCLGQMLGEPDNHSHFDHAMLFNMLRSHLSQSPAKERNRLDSHALEALSDIAACHEMLVALRLHRPQYTNWDVYDIDVGQPWRKMMGAENAALAARHLPAPCSDLISSFYHGAWPSDQKDQVWLAKAQKLRGVRERFWYKTRRLMRAEFEALKLDQEEICRLLDTISVDTTPEYRQLMDEEDTRVHTAIQQRSQVLQQHVTEFTGSIEGLTIRSPPQPPPKTRNKTRGEPSASVGNRTTPVAPVATTGAEPSSTAPLAVSKRSMDLFTRMFKDDATKEVKWDDFVHAMVDAGFTVKAEGGSAVSFTSESRRRIVFHRPHPSPNIDPIMLRAFGNRLASRLQMRISSFTER